MTLPGTVICVALSGWVFASAFTGSVRPADLTPAAGSAAATGQEPAAKPPSAALPLRLTGILSEAGTSERSLCIISCLAPPPCSGLYAPGDQACGMVEVREIRVDAVLVEDLATRRRQWLMLEPASATAAPAPPAPAAEAAPPAALIDPPAMTTDLPRDAVAQYLANLPDVLASARATPRFRDVGGLRAIDGFELSQVKAGGAASELGLRDGDVITAVNGQPLDGMPAVMRLFGQAQALSQVKLTVLRDGRTMTFVFNTK